MSSVPPPPRFVAPAPRPPSAPDAETNWQPWAGIVALLGAFFAAILLQFVVLAVGSAFGSSFDDPSPAVSIVSLLVQDLCFVGAALFFARSAGPISPAMFGLRRTRFWPAVGITVGLFVGYVVFNALYVTLIGADTADNELPSDLGVHQSTIALVAVGLLVTVVAPLAEEFLFRGFMFGALRNWRGPWPAAVITGVVFGCDPRARDRRRVPRAADAVRLPAVPDPLENRLAAAVHRAARDQQLDRVRGPRRRRLPALGTAAWTVGAIAVCMLDLRSVRRSSI